MSLQPLKITAIARDDSGGNNIIPNAPFSVVNGSGGFPQLWEEREGLTPVSNPGTCDANGERQVWVEGGYYSISVGGGQSWEVDLVSAVAELENYAAVRALNGSSFTQVSVAGHSYEADGGGGIFTLDPLDASSADNGGTILVDASGGRWKRSLDNQISVKWFGAAGDGSTDDTASIQAALDCAAIDGKQVFIPSGTYLLDGERKPAYRVGSVLITDTLLVIKSGVGLIGEGFETVLKVADDYTVAGDYRIIASSDITVSDVEISNLTIDGNGQNNLVIDSGVNVRRAYMINFLQGVRVRVNSVYFKNCPGRNVINFGNNTAGGYDFYECFIENNTFENVGASIPGNENQNDHSSIYILGDFCKVSNNILRNDNAISVLSPAKNVVALEVHGRNTEISYNSVYRYTGGANAAATVHNGINNKWIYNNFKGITNHCFNIWTGPGYSTKNLQIIGNTIEIDNTSFSGGQGIWQNPSSGVTAKEVDNLVIDGNTIYGVSENREAQTWSGVYLCAVNGGKITNNFINRTQGAGIAFFDPLSTALNIRDVEISGNTILDCGIHSVVSRQWGMYLENQLTTRTIANISVRNNRIKRTLQPAGVAPWQIRGIRVTGSGIFENVVFSGNIFENIYNYQVRYDFTALGSSTNVSVVPTAVPFAPGSDPTFGVWQNTTRMVEYVVHNLPLSGGYIGKIASTSGGAVSGTWAATTAYKNGVWIKTSTNIVLRCSKSGTSGASEPTVSLGVGEVIADGTAEWVYEAANLAVFKNYGAIV